MVQRIDQDLRRFRQIIRGVVRRELKKYMTTGELLGKKGKEVVSIPIEQIEIPTFKYETRKLGGVGQGDGEEGQPIGVAGGEEGAGGAGNIPGQHILEVDISIDELAEIMGEELETLQSGEGCGICSNTGFHGRTGIFELLSVNDIIKSKLVAGADSSEIRQEAINNGMVTIGQAGMTKVKEGSSSMKDVLRSIHMI